MFLDLVIGEMRLNITFTCGEMFKKLFRSKKKLANADTSVMPETSADTYEEELISYYDVKGVKDIEDKANEFSRELKSDTNGLYDIPPGTSTELETYYSDVEIIDDSYERAMEGQLKRVRGY